jgi:integrase
MPLKLVPPRQGKSPNYSIRGTYLRIYVDRTAGTPEKRAAQKILDTIKRQIELGEYQQPAAEPVADKHARTFADAALAYLKAGGDATFLSPIIELTGEHALRDELIDDIDQIAIDNAAKALYPAAAPATLNRQVYTPISAILKRAGVERKVMRPKGWRGSKATSWLEPDQAFDLLREAYHIEPEFGAFCVVLLYTGMRLSDPLRARVRDLKLGRSLLYVPDTKNGEPRPVHLPPVAVKALQELPPRAGRPRKAYGEPLENGAAGRSRKSSGVQWLKRDPDEKLFRFHVGGRLRDKLTLAMARAGLSFPRRQRGFHIFCHTYGTWMHNYAGLDTYGLTRTGRWKDADSADRYKHTMASPEAKRADLLPTPQTRGKSVESGRGKKKLA